MSNIIDQIEQWAGELRGKTFRAAAEWVLKHKPKVIIETGCYRGGDCDGRSTLILAMLGQEVHGAAFSYDINRKHIDLALELLEKSKVAINVMSLMECDSIEGLSCFMEQVGFVYLDSFDYGPDDPDPCQRHQIAEVGAIYGKLTHPAAILMDDWALPHGGKCGLSVPFLKERGWTVAAEGYQILLTRE